MIVKQYSETIIPAAIQYETDKTVDILQHNITTEENCNFIVHPILDHCNDIKINNYSCLFLTNKQLPTANISTSYIAQSNTHFTYLSSNSGYIQIDEYDNMKYITDADNATIIQLMFDDILSICNLIYYNDVSKKTFNVDITNNKLVDDRIEYVYLIKDNTLYLSLPTNPKKYTFKIQSLYSNITNNNASMRYNNISGDVLSTYDVQHNNMLLNVQYTTVENDTFPCNVLNLQNRKTYIQRDGFNNYWKTTDFNSVKMLQTGTNQEHGNHSIYNINEFYNMDITIKPGMNEFTTPDNLYPYKQININDTTFSKTGAFGSKSPSTSDRVYVHRYPNKQNSDTMLCTWLSSNANGESIWLDRYYNPTLFTLQQALSTKSDEIVFNAYAKNVKLCNTGFYDQQSNVCLTSSQTIQYYHITNDDLHAYINELNMLSLSNITYKDVNGADILQSDSYKLNGDLYGSSYINTTLHTQNNFALSFDIDIYDWNNIECYDIFSTQSNTHGIRLYKDVKLTPTLMAWKKDINPNNVVISIFDTSFNKIDEWNAFGDTEVVNVFRDDNLTFIVVQFEDCVKLYNLFGALLYIFKQPNLLVKAAYYANDWIYVCYENNTLTRYNVYNYSEDISYTTTLQIAGDIKGLVVENDVCYIVPHHMDCISYIPSYGCMYITDRYEGYEDEDGKKVKTNNFLLLNTQNVNNVLLTQNDTKYIDIHSGTHVDDKNDTIFTQHYLTDFTVANDTLYTANTSLFITCNIDRTNIERYMMPVHSSGANSKVYLYTTNEIIDHKYTSNVWILLESDNTDTFELYQFKNNTFTKVKDVYGLSEYNLYKLTGKKYLPGFNPQLKLDIMFKSDNNKIYKTSENIDSILPGQHTILFNMDTVSGNCSMYVDETEYCNIEFNDKGKYVFANDILQNHVVFGNTILFNGGDLASYIKSNNYLLNDVTVGNLCLFDAPLSKEDIRINMLKNKTIPDIVLNLPCGQRCEVSRVNKIYKQTIPDSKSTSFDLVIKNLNLSKKNEQLLSKAIKQYIEKSLPITTKLDEITYKNY